MGMNYLRVEKGPLKSVSMPEVVPETVAAVGRLPVEKDVIGRRGSGHEQHNLAGIVAPSAAESFRGQIVRDTKPY